MPDDLSEDAKNEIIELNGRDLSLLAIVTGLVILACHLESGARRWASAIWETALAIPGAPATWGAVLLVGGVLMYRGRACDTPRARRSHRVGCTIGMYWWAMIAFFWGIAIVDDLIGLYIRGDITSGAANPFGVAMCLYLAVLHARRAKLARERHYG
ncbi:hypothetical protein ACXYX3_17565 [Mycobacterium sp. C3-094]